MASKGKGGKFAQIETTKKFTKKQEGAIDQAYYIKCKMKDGQWNLARVIECRLLEEFKNKKKKTECCYKYYVHYEKFDRRMDEWVLFSRIQLTEEIIEDLQGDLKAQPRIKKKIEDQKTEFEENDEHEGMDQASLRAHEEVTKVKTIGRIAIGKFTCETWYYSPYPQPFHDIDTLYLCEFCLSFYKHPLELAKHSEKCILSHPPGNEIYRHKNVSIFEVDGYKNQTYCENLCYLSKLFLDHKNLYYDVEPFLFFVLTENDQYGHHMVGYFSKEKESQQGYNLSCILVLPFYQRKGYGKFLITFSYELSVKEQKVGTPERPLSDLGRESYLSWWTQRIIQYMLDHKTAQFSIDDICKETYIRNQDIIWTLEQKGLIKYNQGSISICTDEKVLNIIYQTAGREGLEVISEKIHWIPYKVKYDGIKI